MKLKLQYVILAAAALTLSTTSCDSIFNSMGYYKLTDDMIAQLGLGNANGENPAARYAAAHHLGTAATTTSAATASNSSSTVDKSYLQELLNKDYSLKQYLPEEPKRLVWVDDTVKESIDDLLPLMTVTSTSTGKKYMPRGVTTAHSDNDTYFYFVTEPDGTPGPLHMALQYYADDPLNFYDIAFLIEGFDYGIRPATTQKGREGKQMYWENCDVPLTDTSKDVVYALAHGQWCKQTLKGQGGMNHVKMLDDTQRKNFYNVLQLYRLMGGRL